MPNIEHNVALVRESIAIAAQRAQRQPDSITLLAVSKRQSTEAIAAAYQAGIRDVGENYLQEALPKIEHLSHLQLCWHFIGAIQSNKTKDIAEQFDWVHTVDRVKIAQRLSAQRPTTLSPLQICIQVNIDNEPTKAGIHLNDLENVIADVTALPNVRLRGFMCIPSPQDTLDAQRQPFRLLAQQLAHYQQRHPQLDTLSMGMSADCEAAIMEGATIVRIGTDIFGARI